MYATLVVKRLFHFSASEDRHVPHDELTATREERGRETPRATAPEAPRFRTGPRRSNSGFVPANPPEGREGGREGREGGPRSRPQKGGYRGSAPKRPGAPRGKPGNRSNFRRK